MAPICNWMIKIVKVNKLYLNSFFAFRLTVVNFFREFYKFFCVRYGVAWGAGFHTMFTQIVVSEFYRKYVTFWSITIYHTCLLNFSNCSLTEQTCKNVPRHLKLEKYWPISLTGMKPSFGFCYIYSPGLGTKWSLRKDIKTVFKWGPPKQSKVLVTSHKIYK